METGPRFIVSSNRLENHMIEPACVLVNVRLYLLYIEATDKHFRSISMSSFRDNTEGGNCLIKIKLGRVC